MLKVGVTFVVKMHVLYMTCIQKPVRHSYFDKYYRFYIYLTLLFIYFYNMHLLIIQVSNILVVYTYIA